LDGYCSGRRNYRENKEKILLLPEASKGFIPARFAETYFKKEKNRMG
jgi:hypothetical protein